MSTRASSRSGSRRRSARASNGPRRLPKRRSVSSARSRAATMSTCPSFTAACRRRATRSTRSICGPAAPKRPCCESLSARRRDCASRPLRRRLRRSFPSGSASGSAAFLPTRENGPDQIEAGVAQLRFGFEPADIVNEVMSFGSPTPIEVAVSGPDFAASRAFAAKVHDQLAKVPTLCDLQYVQSLNYPTVEVRVDRERAGLSGVTTADVARALVSATSSSRFVVPNYWRDPEERRRLPGPGRDPARTTWNRVKPSPWSPCRSGRERRCSCATWPASSRAPCRANTTATTCAAW